MDSIMEKFVYDMAKRRLRASSIVREPFRPHAYVPLEINPEKIRQAIKALGFEEIPDEALDEVADFKAMAMVHLDFSTRMEDSLRTLGTLLSDAEVSNVSVVCDMAVGEGEEKMDVLCVAMIDLKASDSMIMLPYAVEPEDVTFGEASISGAVEEEMRDQVIEGFLKAEAQKFLRENPEGDTDTYVDNLPTEFPNVEGALNEE